MQADDFRTDLPVSRGQWRRIAELGLDLLNEQPPADRYQATVLLVRLEESRARQAVETENNGAGGHARDPVIGAGG